MRNPEEEYEPKIICPKCGSDCTVFVKYNKIGMVYRCKNKVCKRRFTIL